MINEKLAFLTAPRFYAMVIGAFVYYGKTKGFIGDAEMVLIETILVGFIGVRSFDRIGESIGGARELDEESVFTDKDNEKAIDKQSEVDTDDAG